MGEELQIPQPDINRRNFLRNAATLAGAGTVAYGLLQAEPAHAAVETALNFRNRRTIVNSANSPSLDAPTTTFDVSQEQPGAIQATPTPDLQATKTELDIQSDRLTIKKQE